MNSVVVTCSWTVVRQNKKAVWIASATDDDDVFMIPRELLKDINLHKNDELDAIITCDSETNVVLGIKFERILSYGYQKFDKKGLWKAFKEKFNIVKRMTEGG